MSRDMPLAWPLDINSLMEAGAWLYKVYAPKASLFPKDSEKHQAIATVSWLSSRQELWRTYVCLRAYASQQQLSSYAVLEDIPTEQLLFGEISSAVHPFLEFCHSNSGMPNEVLLGVVYMLKLVVGAEGLMGADKITEECIAGCYADNYPHDQEGFHQCVENCG